MNVDLPDGRRIEVLVEGPESGLPLVVHHGTPGAAVSYRPMVEAATRRGLRSVHYSRPGYGGSSPQPGRRVADAAEDTAAVLDALGAAEFLTAGGSGGGPHALACAALLPERCRGAATLAGVAPFGAEGLDWLAGMGEDNVAEFGAALDGIQALTAFLSAQLPVLAALDVAQVIAAFGDLLSPVDARALTGEFADYIVASFRHAVSTGIAGWRDDDLAFTRDWGFAPADAARVAIWQGGQDRMVPFAHGEWLAAHVPGARVRLLPEEGHLTLVASFGDILDDLLAEA